MTASPVEAILGSIEDLEPLPQTASRLSSLLTQEDATLDEITELVSFDPALTAKLIAMANSAAYAGRANTVTVRDAVVRLGSGAVLTLVMATSVNKKMMEPIPEYGLSESSLWRHSMASAVVAECMRRHVAVSVPSETYVCALLHDFGKLVLGRFLPPHTLELLEKSRAEGRSEFDVECEVLAMNHAEVGGLIARHWGLPENIVTGITHHHNPIEGKETVCKLVYVADLAADLIEEQPSPVELPAFHDTVMKEVGLTEEGFQRMCIEASERVIHVLSMY